MEARVAQYLWFVGYSFASALLAEILQGNSDQRYRYIGRKLIIIGIATLVIVISAIIPWAPLGGGGPLLHISMRYFLFITAILHSLIFAWFFYVWKRYKAGQMLHE